MNKEKSTSQLLDIADVLEDAKELIGDLKLTEANRNQLLQLDGMLTRAAGALESLLNNSK